MKSGQEIAIARRSLAALAHACRAMCASCGWLRRLAKAPGPPKLGERRRLGSDNVAQAQNPTYCLLESDTLIDGFRVSTGRLLMSETNHPSEVHLTIEVTIKVLRVGSWNQCLMGD